MRTLLAAVVLAAIGIAPTTAMAQPASAVVPRCAVTPAALTQFFDDQIPALLRQDRVPGAVVSVVSGRKAVFAKGYGMADAEHRTPFDPSRSLVRIASISKLFTWTAVMQQVQAGKLDLHTDVNRYLTGLRIPATYPQPVTLLDLMDHTAGFEDFAIGTSARRAQDVPPLGDYLARHQPARIRPPGEMTAYSNYGAALAGYIVTLVSGESYAGYVQRHLFDPLGMAHSTAAQPIPAALAAGLARSYDSAADPPRPIPFDDDPMAPDGSISATAADMAQFMIANLNQGRAGTGRILDPATVATMQQRSFAADARLGGYAHGFMFRMVNGHRVLLHDGGWEGFRSVLILVPGCDLGMFASFNGTGAESGAAGLMGSFFNRFAPASGQPEDAGRVPVSTAARAAPTAGFYEPTRRNESGVEKVTNLLAPSRLTVRGDGTLRFVGKTWTPQGGGLYRAGDGSDHLVFLAAAGGRRYAATDGPAYQLMPVGETLPVNLAVLLLIVLPALGVLAMPVAWAVRRLRRRSHSTSARWRAARLLAAGSAVVAVAFVAVLAATVLGNTDEFLYHVPVWFALLLAVPVLVLLGGAVATALTVVGWRNGGARLTGKIHQLALLTAIAALAWFAVQWNLLGWRYA